MRMPSGRNRNPTAKGSRAFAQVLVDLGVALAEAGDGAGEALDRPLAAVGPANW